MTFIHRDEADRIVRPYFDDLTFVMHTAWGDWRTGGLAHQLQHKRVRANYVWNQLLSHAKRRFDARESVRVETLRNWDGVLIDDRVFIRMKKGSHELLSRNYPTQAALAFHDQVQDLFGGIARLELLYILDDAETEIERIVLIQRHKKSVAWSIDLLGEVFDVQNVIAFVPTPIAGSPADRMIKPKEGNLEGEHWKPQSGS